MTDSKTCAHCGTTFDTSDWYPTTACQDEDGVEIYSFCCEECQDAWKSSADDD